MYNISIILLNQITLIARATRFYFVKIVIFCFKSHHFVNLEFYCSKSRYNRCVLLPQLKIYPFFLKLLDRVLRVQPFDTFNAEVAGTVAHIYICKHYLLQNIIFFTSFYIKNMTQKVSARFNK